MFSHDFHGVFRIMIDTRIDNLPMMVQHTLIRRQQVIPLGEAYADSDLLKQRLEITVAAEIPELGMEVDVVSALVTGTVLFNCLGEVAVHFLKLPEVSAVFANQANHFALQSRAHLIVFP